MTHIQKTSQHMTYVLLLLLIILPLLSLGQWILIDWEPVRKLVLKGIILKPVETPEGLVNLATIHLSTLSQIIGILSSIVGSFFTYLGLTVLYKIFQNYKKGNIFSITNTKNYRKLGYFFLLDALIAKPFGEMLSVLVATLSNPPGHRYITITFGTPNLEGLFVGTIIIIISWVMLEAYKLQIDSDLTI